MLKRIERQIACILVLAVLLCYTNFEAIKVNAQVVETQNIEQQKSNDKITNKIVDTNWDIKVSYNITSKWDNHCNVDITLENITDKRIDNWEIYLPVNYEIENIWNARITETTEEEYTIRNDEWNQDIPVSGFVSFGMTVKCFDEIEIPEYLNTNCLWVKVDDEKYNIDIKTHSQWDDKVNGQIIINNISNEKIEDWSIVFDSNFQIEEIWNAKIFERADFEDIINYDIENSGYNQNIPAKQSVEFGFIATCDEESDISNVELYSMGSEFDFSEEENEDDYGVDEFVLDSDSFRTEEEYTNYLLEKGFTDEDTENEVSTFSMRRSGEMSVQCTGASMKLGLGARATQNYLPLSDGSRYLMSTKNQHAFATYQKLDATGNFVNVSTTKMKNFAHGQTFEQFFVPKEGEQYLLAGNPTSDGTFARNIAIMPRSYFVNNVLPKKKFNFTKWCKKKGNGFRIMSGLECANAEGKATGTLFRTDAAVTASGSTLVIWKETRKGSGRNQKRYYEISLYDVEKLIKYYEILSRKGKNQKEKLRLSFSGSLKKELKSACIGSFREKHKTNQKSKLKPNGSFQSIDIEEYFEDGKAWYQVVLTSGNEIGYTNRPITVSKLVLHPDGKKDNKGNKKPLKYKAYRNRIELVGHLSDKFEIEGGHIMGRSTYQFILVKEVNSIQLDGTVKKLREQYLAKVDLDSISTSIQ